jgi:hypothetical protein
MMNMRKIGLVALVASALVGANATANEWVVGDAIQAKGGAAVFNIGFAGDGEVMDAMLDLNYDATAFTANVEAVNGASCTIHPKGGVVRVITPIADQPLAAKVTALCNVTLLATSGSKAAPTLAVGGSECARGAGKDASCDLSSAGQAVK